MSLPYPASLLFTCAVFLQAVPQPSSHPAVQFLTFSANLKKHAIVVDNELTLTAGAREPYLSSAAVTDFEILGEIRMTEDADARLIVYAWEPAVVAAPVFPLALGNTPRFGELSGEGVRATHDSNVAAAFRGAARNWQSIRISCVGRHVRVAVPAGVVTEGDLPTPQYGRIAIEVTKGSLSLRNWQFVRDDGPAVRPLAEDNPDAIDGDEFAAPGEAAPALRREVKPQYTENAMRRRVEGNTELEAIVERDGFVGPIRVTKSLDRELDIQAIRAIRQWTFSPAMKDGQPVRCRITIVMTFRL